MKRAVPSEIFEEIAFSWEKCCFGQREKGEMVCPAQNAVASQRNRGYMSLAPHLEALRTSATFLLPSGHRADVLDEGEGIQATLIAREARYHKLCAWEYQPPKVYALLKRLEAERQALEAAAALEEATPTHAPDPPLSTPGPSTSRARTRSTSQAVLSKGELCFLCGRPGERNNPLHLCQTKEVEERIIKCANDLGNSELLSQIFTYGDLIAEEAKYHTACLVKLYNSARRVYCSTKEDMDEMLCESMAFADLISYLSMKLIESVQTVFVVADLVRFYSARLANPLGVENDDVPVVHSTRLREKILARMPELREQKAGRDIVLVHCKANVLLVLEREDQDDNANGFLRFVKTLRKCTSETHMSFPGNFGVSCEERSVPPSLLSAVTMLLYGFKFRQNCGATRPALTISQLIMTNFRETMPRGEIVRHDIKRETPLPLYLALHAYGYSRDRAMIDELHRLGLSVSHNRIMEITSQFCRMVVQRAEEEGVLCPGNLKKNCLTILALYNLDFKARSTTSGPEFHGTGISIFQLPTVSDKGQTRQFNVSFQDVEQRGARNVPLLPSDYTFVSDSFVLPDKVEPFPSASTLAGMEPSITHCLNKCLNVTHLNAAVLGFWKKKSAWLSHTHEQLNEPEYCENFSWGAFHAISEENHPTPGISAMLPLLDEKSTSPGIIKHAYNSTPEPGPNAAVLCMDQQLYVLAKKLQWLKRALYGEERVVMLLGGFHIEKAFLAVIGQMLEKSGWVHILACSGVTTAGSAEGALKVLNNVTKPSVPTSVSRVAGACFTPENCCRSALIFDAYDEQQPNRDLTFDEWVERSRTKSPTFYFWLLVLNLEILLLTFVKSQRQGNYGLYTESLTEMLPWMFVFDHQNYSRWLPIHLRDLLELKQKAPDVHHLFKAGQFVFSATGNPFSLLAIDQAHEQNNAKVKSAGGVVGLTQDAAALLRVMAAGPEVARLLYEFRGAADSSTGTGRHHEQYEAYQKQFKDHCSALINSFKSYQNPFCELGGELITLDTRESVSVDSVKVLCSIEQTGRDKYMDFVEKRIKSQSISFYNPISKNSVKIFATKKKPLHPNREQMKMAQLKEDNQLYWRLYVASLARQLDLDKFFEYDNQNTPPALSAAGKLRSGTKADLVQLLQSVSPIKHQPSVCQGLLFDGAHLVHNVPPRPGVKTFEEYFRRQLVPHVEQAAVTVLSVRIDFAWDLYAENSIKNTERESRGAGVRRKDLPEKGTIPKDWPDYLKHSENKKELFGYLSARFVREMECFQVATNVGDTFQTHEISSTCLKRQHCLAMEEADPRIISHVMDMAKNGIKSVAIRSTDTDVVVLATAAYHRLAASGLQELWIHYGSGTHARYLAIHSISAALGQEKCEALPGFHAFTGCDTTSYLSGCGKIKAWKLWQAHPEITVTFKALSTPLLQLGDDTLSVLERFTVLLYDAKSDLGSVNATRKDLFVSRNRSLFAIPPTAGALRQHCLRALYQAGHLWGKA
ncbi:BRISC and BRCA1-A complex member 2, partial [Frankliniella fusca]